MTRSEFEPFVRGRLRPACRVLEIGCGSGELARALSAAGHAVTAIDPNAPEGDLFERVRAEDFAAPARSFDAVVASRSLHHLDDLSRVLDRIGEWLRSGGQFMVGEFGWDRMDARTLFWYYARWKTLGARSRKGPPPASVADCERQWETEHHDLHGAHAMIAAFDERFTRHHFEWTPYLCRELGDEEGEAAEAEAIQRGEINAIGFVYAGGLLDVEG